jgi:hypothetical protein
MGWTLIQTTPALQATYPRGARCTPARRDLNPNHPVRFAPHIPPRVLRTRSSGKGPLDLFSFLLTLMKGGETVLQLFFPSHFEEGKQFRKFSPVLILRRSAPSGARWCGFASNSTTGPLRGHISRPEHTMCIRSSKFKSKPPRPLRVHPSL